MTDAGPAPRPRRRRGFLFPLVLIALGVTFFAANLGYLPPVSARALLSLWPVLLIVFGVEAILARREPYLALAIEILVIVASVALVVAQPRGLFLPLGASSTSATVARDGARSLSLRVEGGAGTYTLAGGAAALVDARSDGGEISVTDDRRGDEASVRVRPVGVGDVVVFGATPPMNVDVRVASDVPASLRLDGGAGDFTLDLRDVRVRDVRVETGASKVELTLPRPAGDVPVRVQAGAASIVIVVPDGVEARVTTTGGLLTTSSDNARLGAVTRTVLGRNASAAETPGYASAKDRVTVTVEAGASSITIR